MIFMLNRVIKIPIHNDLIILLERYSVQVYLNHRRVLTVTPAWQYLLKQAQQRTTARVHSFDQIKEMHAPVIHRRCTYVVKRTRHRQMGASEGLDQGQESGEPTRMRLKLI